MTTAIKQRRAAPKARLKPDLAGIPEPFCGRFTRGWRRIDNRLASSEIIERQKADLSLLRFIHSNS